MKSFLKAIKYNLDNFQYIEANKNKTKSLIKLSKACHTNFLKSNFCNKSPKTKSKNSHNNNNNNINYNNENSNYKHNKENNQSNYNSKKPNKENNKENEKADNSNSKNIQKENINSTTEPDKKDTNRKLSVKKIKETNTDKFLNFFKKNFPLELNKKKTINIDHNLTCFVPYDQLINRVRAVSIGKTYLANLVDSEADYSDICEDNFFKLLISKVDNLKDFRIEDDDIIKYNLSFNKSFKKVKFSVNLYNIKNYMCIGYDPSKDVAKNLKNFQYLEDHIIGNQYNNNSN